MSIRQKLNIGFGVLVALTLVVVALDYWSSARAARQITQTTRLHLPTVLASTRAQADLLQMLSSMRGYLALGEQKYREEYAQAEQAFEASVLLLDSLSSTWTNSRHKEELQRLKTVFGQWAELPEQLFTLRDDQLRREPALRILMQDAQPLLLKMMLGIRQLLQGQGQRPASQDNLLLLEEMAHFQASFYAMMAGLRTYITTGRQSFKFEYTSNLTNNDEALRKLRQKQKMLTAAQQQHLAEILKHRDAFLQLPKEMFHILEGEQAREDLFLFRTRAVPLAQAMRQSLERMTSEQQTSFRLALFSGVQELAGARRRSLLGGGVALLVGAGLALLLRHNLVDRIDRITKAARRIQAGDLKSSVPVTSADEIGILGQTFNQMTTQLRQMMQDLTRAKDAAESANQAKSAFLANMSHELRSPLTAILGFAQMMFRRCSLPREEREHLGIIWRNGEHLLTLINQVLDLSKIEAGRITLNERSFNLHRLLNDIEDMFALKADNKHLSLVFHCDETIPQYVRTDEVKLRQVLINLLNNAIKFTEQGKVELRIRNEELRMKDSQFISLHFSVADTGPGIAPEEMGQVFEAFGQTETGRQAQEGTGLGLPISRKFVRLMGGDLSVESEVGHGTTFTFVIQAHVPEAVDITPGGRIRQAVALEPGQPRYRMLIVDDKPDNRKLLVALLAPLNCELREAENGQAAIEAWETWHPHLIWMDMRMPVLNGYEATKRIKNEEFKMNNSTKPHCTIIAVTASSLEEERAVTLEAGCDDFLRKPFRENEIFALLQTHLSLRFVYEEEGTAEVRRLGGVGERQEAQGADVFTSEVLRQFPADWLMAVHDAAERLRGESIIELLDRLPPEQESIAQAFTTFVEDFQFDTIVTLTQQAIEHKES